MFDSKPRKYWAGSVASGAAAIWYAIKVTGLNTEYFGASGIFQISGTNEIHCNMTFRSPSAV